MITPDPGDIEEQNTKKKSCNDYLYEALELIGYGKFQWQITFVCGLGYLAAGFQYGLNSYLIPAASCDLQMDSERKGTLNSVFLAGSVFSTYLWGMCADLAGRKGVLVWTLFIDGILTLASSFAQDFITFCFFRFCAGFLVASPSGLLFAYLGEFHSVKDSPRSVCILGVFFTLSWLLLPGICWLVLPIQWSFHTSNNKFIYNSWRILVALISLPLFLSSVLLAFEPETPKYLVSQERYQEAEIILQKMHLMNYGETSNNIIKLPKLNLSEMIDNCHNNKKEQKRIVIKRESQKQLIGDSNDSNSSNKSCLRLLNIMWHQTTFLFMPPHIQLTALFALLSFANMFGYFGLGLWLPELFNRLEQHYQLHPNVTVTVCELSKMVLHLPQELNTTTSVNSSSNSSSSSSSNSSCDQELTINPQVFLNTLLVGGVCLIGNILSVFLAKKLEYRIFPVCSMLLSGVCVVAIYLFRSSIGNLIASTIFQASIATANYTLTSVIIDLFPTTVRAVGLAIGLLAGRLSSVISNLLLGQLLENNCDLLFGIIIAILTTGGFLCFLIPKNHLNNQ